MLPDTFSCDDWAYAKQYWHYSCAVCGHEEGFEWTLSMDHWIPLTDPYCPGTVVENIVPLCEGNAGCNNIKSDRAPYVFLVEKLGARKAKAKLQEIEVYLAHVAQCKSTQQSNGIITKS